MSHHYLAAHDMQTELDPMKKPGESETPPGSHSLLFRGRRGVCLLLLSSFGLPLRWARDVGGRKRR
jgi:hypothetical protein